MAIYHHHRRWYFSLLCLMALAGCTGTPPVAESPTPTGSPTPAPASPNPTLTVSPTPLSPFLTISPVPTVAPTTPGKSAAVLAIEGHLAELVTKATTLTVQSVNCPANLEEKAGKTYDCDIVSEVGPFTAVIQPTGQPGKFRWGTKRLLLLSKLNDFIQKSVQSQGGGKVTVDCGGKARPARPGETFECKVVDAKGQSKVARITVRDEAGNVYIAPL